MTSYTVSIDVIKNKNIVSEILFPSLKSEERNFLSLTLLHLERIMMKSFFAVQLLLKTEQLQFHNVLYSFYNRGRVHHLVRFQVF